MPQTIAVVIPAFNEEACLPLVLDAMPKVEWVIVVDNGSTDATHEVAADHGAIVVFEPLRGYGSACKAGIAEAKERGAEIIVIVDADHSMDLDEMHQLVEPILADEADLVLGDRTKTAQAGAMTIPQRFGNVLSTEIIKVLIGHGYRDMGPFRAIRVSSLSALEMEDNNFGWNVEMQMKAVTRGLRIREIPVAHRPRAQGESKVSGTAKGVVRAGAKILWSTWRYWE